MVIFIKKDFNLNVEFYSKNKVLSFLYAHTKKTARVNHTLPRTYEPENLYLFICYLYKEQKTAINKA